MSDRVALGLAVAILALVLADALWLGWELPMRALRLFVQTADMMAIWR